MKKQANNNDARANGKHYGMNWIRKDLRLAIMLRDGMACMWCGQAYEDSVTMTLDHVKPHSQGGTNKASNLVCACHRCNSVRQDRSAWSFAADAAQYVGVSQADIFDSILAHLAQDIKPFRTEAKAILARRPTWQAALNAAK